MTRNPLLAIVLFFSIVACLLWLPLRAGRADEGYTPAIAPASPEADRARQRMRVPAGTRVDLFAAEPMLANPVCFCVDGRGRFYVAETFRLHAGVDDVREHMDWLDDDLAARTVEDRVAMLRKHLGKEVGSYLIEHERVRLLEDTKGTGHADRSVVFADGFQDLADGIGAGLLARGNRVWYACIPNLWLLEDTHGQGGADARRVLHRGYGVHTAFYGHDLHGLRMGPDGKLYFSVGDRGLNVQTEGRTVRCTDSGAVLRCDPDGSHLELVATGLRNPQELAFDEYGNLFTGDNNADHGDKARLVYVVEGGDSGWRGAYQYMERPTSLGPWNAEGLWHTSSPGQAAYIIPPVAHIADGPAGFCYHPGVASLPDRYRCHFFLCDFRGGPVQSGIRSFAVKPRGAGFAMVDAEETVWSVLATDVDFAPDGGLYLTDWVEGWDKTGKGRLYRVHDPKRDHDPAILEVQRLLHDGMEARRASELRRLLDHADMRIRQEAQFELARRGPSSIETLTDASRRATKLGRLHGIWGLGQLASRSPAALAPVLALTRDTDPEVRAQAAKVLGWQAQFGALAAAQVADNLVLLLGDTAPRVRFFAAVSLGKMGGGAGNAAAPALIDMLRQNADQDPYLRHAAVMGLCGVADAEALSRAAQDPSPAVRRGVLLALRRKGSPAIAGFLHDREADIVLEAARAIYDVPIPAALPALAQLTTAPSLSDPLAWRALNACYRRGGSESARAIARFAARADVGDSLRIEALRELADWASPSGRDRVVGIWRPLPHRPAADAASALREVVHAVLAGTAAVSEEAALAAGCLGVREAGPLLLRLAQDQGRPASVRVKCLQALDALGTDGLAEAVRRCLADRDPSLRSTARRLQVRLAPTEALKAVAEALEHGDLRERQQCLAVLATTPGAEPILTDWLDRLLAHRVPPELQLDLLEAAAAQNSGPIKERLVRYQAARSKGDRLAPYRETLFGGDAARGKNIFLHKIEVSCQRCHRLQGAGGEVGPDLTGIGSRHPREYLLESLVDPNRQIATGFETAIVETTDGKVYSGIVKAEDSATLRLISAEGRMMVVPKNTIEQRGRGKSAMPEDLVKYLSKSEIRDLVEFLAQLK